MPDTSAAYAIRSRAMASPASAYKASRPSRAAFMPPQASESVSGAARLETNDSSSWVKASMPFAAMTAGGQVAKKSGSTSATSATSFSSRKDFLKPSRPCTLNTAFLVASEPVPAVVGTAMNGVAGPAYGNSGPTPSR